MAESKAPFVATIDKQVVEKIRNDLELQGFEMSKPPYTYFSAKKKGISCTVYTSLKLTVQGSNMREFIEFYLEPEILKNFSYTNPGSEIDMSARIGVDEAGKGDFFGPLCIAGVFAEGETVATLKKLGVRDSKLIKDKESLELAAKIQKETHYHIVKIGPTKYNELYEKFHNLNTLLAWGHATVIEQLTSASSCKKVIIDKFAHEAVVGNAVLRKKLDIELIQRHKAEEDVVVAAASILARAAFLDGLRKLSEDVGMELPKGASAQVIKAGKILVEKLGPAILSKVSKSHFRTTLQVME